MGARAFSVALIASDLAGSVSMFNSHSSRRRFRAGVPSTSVPTASAGQGSLASCFMRRGAAPIAEPSRAHQEPAKRLRSSFNGPSGHTRQTQCAWMVPGAIAGLVQLLGIGSFLAAMRSWMLGLFIWVSGSFSMESTVSRLQAVLPEQNIEETRP